MAPAPVALLDANVLYPSLVRNLLMHCAAGGLIAARWTAAIHEEWTRNLLADRPDLSAQRLQRTRRLMEEAVPDAEVTDYQRHMAALDLPDPGDVHVLAAAIQARAEFLVTQNLRDFPADRLKGYGMEAVTPDDLLCLLLATRRVDTLTVLEDLRKSLKTPPYTAPAFANRLAEVGLPRLAGHLAQ